MVRIVPARVARGGSFVRSVVIDQHLSPEEVTKLYARWVDEKLGAKEVYNGGVVGITADMILAAPAPLLRRIYGKKFTAKLTEIAGRIA